MCSSCVFLRAAEKVIMKERKKVNKQKANKLVVEELMNLVKDKLQTSLFSLAAILQQVLKPILNL